MVFREMERWGGWMGKGNERIEREARSEPVLFIDFSRLQSYDITAAQSPNHSAPSPPIFDLFAMVTDVECKFFFKKEKSGERGN